MYEMKKEKIYLCIKVFATRIFVYGWQKIKWEINVIAKMTLFIIMPESYQLDRELIVAFTWEDVD